MFGFPLLLIPLAVCNIIVFLMPGVSFAAPLFALPLMSGASWTVSLSDALVAFGLLLLLLEVQKSARPGGKYVTDHLLALLIFAGAAVEFVMLPQFANATFFLLTLIAFVDFLSGLALRGRRPKQVKEIVLAAEPIPEPVVMRERAAPVVMTAPPPGSLRPVEAIRMEPAHPELVLPRVEPIVDLDPMLDDPKVPARPPAVQI